MQQQAKRRWRKVHGILLLDKPFGLSSNQALQRARYLFQAEKAGHTGSLDPAATGMLPLCFGEASKVSAYLLDADKRYVTTAHLGQTSTTGDSEGELSPQQVIPTLDSIAIEQCLSRFRGVIEQIPPMYSALKQQGKPLYELARQGISVERAARTITISQLSLLQTNEQDWQLEVLCSKGTYIRTLVEDIGQALGCGAYVSALCRTEVGAFQGYPMYSLEHLQQVFAEQGEAGLDQLLLPIDSALLHLPSLTLNAAQVQTLRYGQRQLVESADAELIRLYTEQQQFLGLGYVQAGILAVQRLLASEE